MMHRLFVFLVAVGAVTAMAQDSPEEKVRLRTLFLDPMEQESLHLQIGDGVSQEIVVTKSLSRPEEIELFGENLLFFEKPLAGEGDSPKPICQAVRPKKGKDLLAVFASSKAPKGGKPKVRVSVYDISDTVWQNGETLVLNMLGTDVRFYLGEFRKGIRAGKDLFVEGPTEKNEYNMARVRFEAQSASKDWKEFRKTSLRYTDQIRYLMVSHYNRGSKRPALLIFKVTI